MFKKLLFATTRDELLECAALIGGFLRDRVNHGVAVYIEDD